MRTPSPAALLLALTLLAAPAPADAASGKKPAMCRLKQGEVACASAAARRPVPRAVRRLAGRVEQDLCRRDPECVGTWPHTLFRHQRGVQGGYVAVLGTYVQDGEVLCQHEAVIRARDGRARLRRVAPLACVDAVPAVVVRPHGSRWS